MNDYSYTFSRQIGVLDYVGLLNKISPLWSHMWLELNGGIGSAVAKGKHLWTPMLNWR